MKHVFENGDGEMVAADTLEQAHLYLDVYLAGEKDVAVLAELKENWLQIDDLKIIPIIDTASADLTVIEKTAIEWASQFNETTQIATTYW